MLRWWWQLYTLTSRLTNAGTTQKTAFRVFMETATALGHRGDVNSLPVEMRLSYLYRKNLKSLVHQPADPYCT